MPDPPPFGLDIDRCINPGFAEYLVESKSEMSAFVNAPPPIRTPYKHCISPGGTSRYLTPMTPMDVDLLVPSPGCSFPGHTGTFRDFWHLFSNMASLFRCTASKVAPAQFLRNPSWGKNLAVISAFFSSSSSHNAIKNVTVIGSGLMGAGIAQVNEGVKIIIPGHYSSSLDNVGEICFIILLCTTNYNIL